MSDQYRQLSIRFNLNKEPQERAWEFLQNRDRRKHGSYSQTVIQSLNLLADEERFRQKEQEEEMIQKIVEGVTKAVMNGIPVFLSGYQAAHFYQPMAVQPAAEAKEQTEENEVADDSLDWDFLGG